MVGIRPFSRLVGDWGTICCLFDLAWLAFGALYVEEW